MFTALSVLIRGMHAFSTADDKPFDEGVAQLVFDIQCWIKLSANAAAQAAGQLGSENQQKMEPGFGPICPETFVWVMYIRYCGYGVLWYRLGGNSGLKTSRLSYELLRSSPLKP